MPTVSAPCPTTPHTPSRGTGCQPVQTPNPKPLSKAKQKANRANARKSTGPRSPQGKANSSKNATTHNLTSTNPYQTLIADTHLHTRIIDLTKEFQATTQTQSDLVAELAHLSRKLQVFRRAEFQLLNTPIGESQPPNLHPATTNLPLPTDEQLELAATDPAAQAVALHFLANHPTPLTRLWDYQRKAQSRYHTILRLLKTAPQQPLPPLPPPEKPPEKSPWQNEPTDKNPPLTPGPANTPTDPISVLSTQDSGLSTSHPPLPFTRQPCTIPDLRSGKSLQHERQMSNPPIDPLKEKFRPDVDPDLDRELNEALGGLSITELEAKNSEAPPTAPEADPAQLAAKGVRRGRVVSIRKGDVLVDLGGKSQGIISELQFDEEPPVVGKEYDFSVERYDPAEGLVILSRRTAGAVQHTVTWENIDVGTLVEGVVTGMNKGGLELQIKSMRAFMPSGQVALFFEKDISTYLGQKLVVEVTQADALTHNLVVSRRNVLEKEKEEARKKLLEELEVGQSRQGTIRSVMDFGAFVDLGGADGLIHVSELSYRRVNHPSEVVKVGDVVDVKVLKADKATGKLSLSLRQAQPDPWGDAGAKYAIGTQVNGKIARVENFGAFVELEEGIEGLLPVSEMSWQRIRSPKDVVKPGDSVRLVVINIDPPARKLTMSLKQAGPDPWKEAAEKFTVDSVVTGKVTRVVDFGAFIELEPGLEGLCHISELSDKRVRTANEAVKPDQEVRVRILEVNKEDRRVSLSIRRAIEAPPPSPEQLAAVEAQKKKKADRDKKRSELKGGLDFDFWNKKL